MKHHMLFNRRIVYFLSIMTETTVESFFGVKAGFVWRALNQNGPRNISDLMKSTSLSREEVNGALGWLGREGKITVEQKGRAMIFSLQEAEARLEAAKGSTIADSVSHEQKLHKAKKPPKKTAKARKIKAPTPSSKFEVLKKALEFINSEFDGNREPTPTQVSNEVGMTSRQVGIALSKLDIKSKSINREGETVKIYPIDLMSRVWELNALDAEGLQKMSEASAREKKNDLERNQEHFTVFD
jgi:hypothetical protein